MTDSFHQALRSAITFLSYREHAVLELRNKLMRKGFSMEIIAQVLTQLRQDNLLNEQRFTEEYLQMRMAKGYGPLRIEQELRERGIAMELINAALTNHDSEWIERAQLAWQKRFGEVSSEPREQAKQFRFLQQRGFTNSQIKEVLSIK
jgi:regulatory protein